MKSRVIFCAVLLMAAGLQTASASLILETFQQFSGTGLGAVSTIVTFQANGTETGCVTFGDSVGMALVAGTGACSAGGDTKTGASQAQVQPLSAAGIGTGAAGAADFALVFNAVQPAGGPLDVTNITAAFFSPSGTLLYMTSGFECLTTAGGTPVAGTCHLENTAQGTGNSGYIVVLDAAQQAAAVAAGAFSSTSNLVAVSAAAGTTANPSAGGSETIFLGSVSGTTPTGQIPEPVTFLLIGSGLAVAGLVRKFRKV